MGFKAINDAGPSPKRAGESYEAREGRLIADYEAALRQIADGLKDEALAALTRLQEHELLKAVEDPSVNPTHTVLQLRLLVLRNKAELLAEADETAEEALKLFCEASETTTDDHFLLYRIGSLAAELKNWKLARWALEVGLKCDPKHILITERLLEVLLHIGDHSSAENVAAYLLKIHPHHPRAAQLSSCLREAGGKAAPPSSVPELTEEEIRCILEPRFPRRFRVKPERAGQEDDAMLIDLPKASWLSLLQHLESSLLRHSEGEGNRSQAGRLIVTVRSAPVEVALQNHRSQAGGNPSDAAAGSRAEAGEEPDNEPTEAVRDTPRAPLRETLAKEGGGASALTECEAMGMGATEPPGDTAAGQRARISKRLVARKAKDEDIGAASDTRNVIATLAPFLEPRQPSLFPRSPPPAARPCKPIDFMPAETPQAEEGKVLEFLAARSGCSHVDMITDALKQLSDVGVENRLPQGVPEMLARIDLIVGWEDAGWERRIPVAQLLAELHLDRALILLDQEKAPKKGGASGPANETVEHHMQVALRNLDDVMTEMVEDDLPPEMELRYYWALARFQQQANEDELAACAFETCKALCCGGKAAEKVITFTGTVRSGSSSSMKLELLNCERDTIISAEAAEPKIRHARFLALTAQAQRLIAEGDMDTAIRHLLPACLGSVDEFPARAAHVRALRVLKDALRASGRERYFELLLQAELLYVSRKLRAVPDDLEDAAMHSASARSQHPPRGVNLSNETKTDTAGAPRPSLRPKDLLDLGSLAETMARAEGVPGVRLRSMQPLLHETQWKLLAYAERCYWVLPSAGQSSLPQRDASYRDVLAAILVALTSLTALEQRIRQTPVPEAIRSMLGRATELLQERQAASALAGGFLKHSVRMLNAALNQLRPATQEGGEEAEALGLRIEGALAQCVFIWHGLDLEDRDQSWGGECGERTENKAVLETPESCMAVWQYIRGHAESCGGSFKRLMRLKGILDSVSQHFPQPPDSVLALSPVSSILQDEISSDDLIYKPRPEFAHILLSPSQDLSNTIAADAGGDVRSSLYNLQLQIEAHNFSISKSSLQSGSGRQALEKLVRLASCDLLYNPNRYQTWDILARSFRKALLSLLDELCGDDDCSEEAGNLLRDMRRKALRATLIARQLVPLGDEQEVSYCEEELGLFLLREVRDLPPEFGRVAWLFPEDGQQRGWNCREAAKAFTRAADTLPEEWQFQHQLGKALEKQGATATAFLPTYARACCYATAFTGGRVEPLYRLHASRLKLLQKGDPNDLEIVKRYCFSEDTAQRLQQPEKMTASPERLRSLEEQSAGRGGTRSNPPSADQEESGPPGEQPTSSPRGTAQGDGMQDAVLRGSALLTQDQQLLIKDCIAALHFCLHCSKGFHKARFRLAQAYDHLLGDVGKAIEELMPLFENQRKPFAIAVETLTDLASEEYGATTATERLEAKQAPSTDESLWGRRPPKVSGTGVSEEWRKHLSSVRKYLSYCLRLLAKAGDTVRLQAAVHTLRTPAFQALYPGFTDILREATGLLAVCLATKLAHLMPDAFDFSPVETGAQVPVKLCRTLSEAEIRTLESAFQLYADHSVQIEGAKPKWSEAIVPALEVVSFSSSALAAIERDPNLEEPFRHSAIAYILHLSGASDGAERLAGIAAKSTRPSVMKRLKAVAAEQPFLSALATACSKTMAACLAQLDMACAARMEIVQEAARRTRGEATPQPPEREAQPLQTAVSAALSTDQARSEEASAVIEETGEDNSPNAADMPRRTSRSPAPTRRRPQAAPPTEPPALEDPVAAQASEAYKRLRVLFTLHKAGEQLLHLLAAADQQEDRAERASMLVSGVVAYVHLMHGKDVQLAAMSLKVAETICVELSKQPGRAAAASGAAPVPDLKGRLASDKEMHESPPSPRHWPTAHGSLALAVGPPSPEPMEIEKPGSPKAVQAEADEDGGTGDYMDEENQLHGDGRVAAAAPAPAAFLASAPGSAQAVPLVPAPPATVAAAAAAPEAFLAPAPGRAQAVPLAPVPSAMVAAAAPEAFPAPALGRAQAAPLAPAPRAFRPMPAPPMLLYGHPLWVPPAWSDPYQQQAAAPRPQPSSLASLLPRLSSRPPLLFPASSGARSSAGSRRPPPRPPVQEY